MTRVTSAPAELLARWQRSTTIGPKWAAWEALLERNWKYIEGPFLGWMLTSAAFLWAGRVALHRTLKQRSALERRPVT